MARTLSWLAKELGGELKGNPEIEIRRVVHPAYAEDEHDLALVYSASVAPIVKARGEWEGNEQRGIPGEKDEAANALCFREPDPLDAEFERLARVIFSPVLEHQLPDSP